MCPTSVHQRLSLSGQGWGSPRHHPHPDRGGRTSFSSPVPSPGRVHLLVVLVRVCLLPAFTGNHHLQSIPLTAFFRAAPATAIRPRFLYSSARAIMSSSLSSSSTPPPFHLVLPPAASRLPLLFDSPHSGRYYPPDFRSRAHLEQLRKGEDAYVDLLISPYEQESGNIEHPPIDWYRSLLSQLPPPPPPSGRGDCGTATLLLANYPRTYIDVNRAADDIDSSMLVEGDGFPFPLCPSDKSKRGLGLLRRLVNPGVEIYDRRLSAEEVMARLTNVYWPYHSALCSALDAIQKQHGFCWHIDWHSMKSKGNSMTPDGAAARPDFVVSDLEGKSCCPELRDLVVSFLTGRGYKVGVNTPYKGGQIIKLHGGQSPRNSPTSGVHSIQIEINRSLYLDEERCCLHAGFWVLKESIQELTTALGQKLEELMVQARDNQRQQEILAVVEKGTKDSKGQEGA